MGGGGILNCALTMGSVPAKSRLAARVFNGKNLSAGQPTKAYATTLQLRHLDEITSSTNNTETPTTTLSAVPGSSVPKVRF